MDSCEHGICAITFLPKVLTLSCICFFGAQINHFCSHSNHGLVGTAKPQHRLYLFWIQQCAGCIHNSVSLPIPPMRLSCSHDFEFGLIGRKGE